MNFDHQQGFSDVSNWPVTFGFGVGDRAEIFGAWTVIRRIDRDYAPDLPSDGLHGGRFDQRVSVRAPGLVRQPARRFLAGRQGQPDVRVEAAAGRARRARHGEAADGEERRGRRRHRRDWTSPSTASSARKSTSASSSPATAASSSVAIRTTCLCRTASAGASAPASRRAASLAADRRTPRRVAVRRRRLQRAWGPGRRGRLASAVDLRRGLVDALHARADLAAPQRLLRGRRRELAPGSRRPQRFRPTFEDETRRRVRLPGPHRLSPGRARVRAAAATAADPAPPLARQAGSRARREGVVQPVHGGSRQGLDGHGRGKQLHQLCRHLQLDGADRQVHERRPAVKRRGPRR